MSKAEEYIKKYTRMCINLDSRNYKPIPWITPYHAEQVAQIAREEVIEKVCEWLKSCSTYKDMNGNTCLDKDMYNGTVEDFKEFMEDKV